MANKFTDKWLKAKAEYEALTGKKKPKESKGLFNAFGSHTGLSGSLLKVDAALNAAQEAQSLIPKVRFS